MYQLKGFVEIEPLISNTANVTATVGELSTYSTTYAKDKGIYTFETNKSLSLISFSSKSTNTPGVTVNTPQDIIDMGLSIANWIYVRQTTSSTNDTKNAFYTAYNEEYLSQCDYLSCGEMVLSSDGHNFPEWVTWKNRNYTIEDNINKIWFSDSSFREQYDEYEIVIIPPVANVDIFFLQYPEVLSIVNSRSFTDSLDLIRIAKGDYPETILSSDSYNYCTPNNSALKIATNWPVLLYGCVGNNSDIVISAIADYILAHSAHTETEWKAVFPDIFRRTEFTILPRWHNYSIEDRVLQSGIYSPIVNTKKELAYVKATLPAYSVGHIENHLMIMSNPYKSLLLDIISNFDNRDNLFEITQLYPDILNVSTTSNDFNRMSADTQGFMNLLSRMLPIAENLLPSTDIPVGMRRAIRNNIMYLTASYKNILYLVSSKATTPMYS